MTDSIYAPPEADVTAPADADGLRYYIVAPKKFLLLAILTAGLYLVYWFYRNWQQVKTADNSTLWPIPRAIFSIFFTHALLADVDAHLTTRGKTYDWKPTAIATTFVVVAIAATIAGQVAEYVPEFRWLLLATLPVPLLYGFILLGAQKAINAASDDVGGLSNSGLTAANWLWMILGSALWAVGVYGNYLLYTNPELFAA